MTAFVRDTAPATLANAIAANQIEQFRLLVEGLGGEWFAGPDGIRFATGIPYPLFNGVFATHFVEGAIEATIAEQVTAFMGRGLPMTWHLGPNPEPADLAQRLRGHGLRFEETLPGMAVDINKLNSPLATIGLAIASVAGQEDAEAFDRVLRRGFGLPDLVGTALHAVMDRFGYAPSAPMRHYLGRLDGEPVATTTLIPGAGVAGIYNVATLPAVRRRGIGAALTAAALQDGRRAGYRVGILQSSDMGFGVYRTLGFRQYCSLTQYVWTP